MIASDRSPHTQLSAAEYRRVAVPPMNSMGMRGFGSAPLRVTVAGSMNLPEAAMRAASPRSQKAAPQPLPAVEALPLVGAADGMVGGGTGAGTFALRAPRVAGPTTASTTKPADA